MKNSPLKKVLTIVGSTASGKTTLAIEIAKRINGEIISLDSRQVFKGMAIGTAQPTKKQMATVKHHLIGCLEPAEFISSGKYASLVKEKINDIISQNKLIRGIENILKYDPHVIGFCCGSSPKHIKILKKQIIKE